MKPARIIALIVAVAIGLIIATQFKPETDNKQTQSIEEVKTSDTSIVEEQVETTDIIANEKAALDYQTTQNSNQITETNTPMITLKTNKGDIEIALNPEKAPVTAENFIKYAKEGHYNGTIFHRVIKNFMIQGGGFESGMKQKAVGAPIINEADNGLKNNKYTIAMARTGDPHSATAQFFINSKDNDFLNFTSQSQSGWGYAVFGEVVSGQDVVDAIEGVATSQVGPFGDVPVEDIVIESVIVSE